MFNKTPASKIREPYGRPWRRAGAIDVARSDPPRIIKGNLLTDLEPLIAMAPKGVTLVIFHMASRQGRDRFAAMMRRKNAVWISNEAPALFSFPTTAAPPAPKSNNFLMMVDDNPVAWTSPHGQSIDWFRAPG